MRDCGLAAWYSTFLNSLVHVVMYTYYFTAAMLGSNEKAKKKYLWWGRYLTQFQMFQFVTMMAQVCP
jgi:elongation of very long chain fatty acids protein 4